jgi:hypothetical protein
MKERGLYFARDIYGNKPFDRKKIVLTAFVYDSYVPILSSIFIGQHTVDLVKLQRGGILAIVYADSKLRDGMISSFHLFNPRIVYV